MESERKKLEQAIAKVFCNTLLPLLPTKMEYDELLELCKKAAPTVREDIVRRYYIKGFGEGKEAGYKRADPTKYMYEMMILAGVATRDEEVSPKQKKEEE